MSDKEKLLAMGKKLRQTMNELSISVKELAEKTGMPSQTIYSILNGHHRPSPEKLKAMCNVLHLSMDSLFDLETNAFPIYPDPYKESLSYAAFEDNWFSPHGGERISVSRGFSTANQSFEMRESIFRQVLKYSDAQVKTALEGFEKRNLVIGKKEKHRVEIVVKSELVDLIQQKDYFSTIPQNYIFEMIEKIMDTLINKPHKLEVFIIPRQYFLVNYEIINREVILFDLGSVFLRQTHQSLLEHFLKEVEEFKSKYAIYQNRYDVVEFLKVQLEIAKPK
ncbi:helix-turn-helix transcriptional regulator [candidate division KSB1 bacterium]|nr:helix-turn-helix transcriptional regulator [candidate division KSB1 bacterium]MBL7092483.1 helix-turn-helix transcriptional regulator [candidate division KSB1 bacterium]